MNYILKTIVSGCLLLCIAPFTIAQGIDTLHVFFETDRFQEFNAEALDGYLKQHDVSLMRVTDVIGYADQRGSSEYNRGLSGKRADQVHAYLKAYEELSVDAKPEAAGELQTKRSSLPDALAKSRRVDVVIERSAPIERDPMPELEPITEEVELKPEEDVITFDTTVNSSVVLEGLSFIPGRHYPTPASTPTLLKLVNTMKQNPTLEIEIQGHICCSYDAEDGMDNDTGEPFLSRNRAEFVYEFLTEYGIDEDRMSFIGLGSTQPKVFPEESDEDRQANRRVEIKVKHK